MKGFKGVVGGAVAVMLHLPAVIQALLLLILLDLVSGLVKAFYTGTVNSKTSWRGMVQKTMVLMLVAVGWIAEHKMGVPMDLDIAVAGFFCVTEGISIIENAKDCGLSVPKFLSDRFTQLAKEAEEKK